MEKILGLLCALFLFAAASPVEAARWVPIGCQFDVPRMHRDQTWGTYKMHGATREEAKKRTTKLCKSELEAYFPGKCDELAADYYRWGCMWSPRWEF